MTNQKLIVNARIPGYTNLQNILIDRQNIIKDIFPSNTQINLSDISIIDVAKDWISLGGVDLQINGALGLAFPELQSKNLEKLSLICDFLWEQGIDAFLPTIVTSPIDKIHRSLKAIDKFIQQQKPNNKTAKIIGVHLEGPFLNPEKKGAHPEQYLLPLNLDRLKEILNDYQNIVKIITLAPELDPTGETISYLKKRGIIISIGHSLANADRAKKTFKLGASMVTHAFNAMTSLHHRQPGLLGEAIINPNVYCGVIADGNHVSPTILKILLKASDYEKGIFLVSDALAGLGISDGIYPWDDRSIQIKKGTARLENGTLAGTTLSLLEGVRNIVKWEISAPSQGILMATESPRKAIGIDGINVGRTANLLRWNLNKERSDLSWTRI